MHKVKVKYPHSHRTAATCGLAPETPAQSMAARPDEVAALLAQTLHPGTQAAGAAGLRSLERPGAGLARALLGLCASPGTAPDVRLAAALYAKNMVRRLWGDDSTGVLSDAERAEVRDGLVSVMVSSSAHGAVQRTLGDAVCAVASLDFPETWPGAAAALVAAVSPADVAGSVAALRTLHRVAKPLRTALRTDDVDIATNAIVAAAGEPIVALLSSVVPIITSSPASADAQLCDLLLYVSRLLRSLVAHDLPAAVEASLSTIVGALCAIVKCAFPPGRGRKLSAACASVLQLLSTRYDADMAPLFAGVVDACVFVLLAPGQSEEDVDADSVACSAMRTLAGVARYASSDAISPEAASQLIAHVVVPSMALRPSDVAAAASADAEEALGWVRLASDESSRRAAAVELARALVAREAHTGGPATVHAALQQTISASLSGAPEVRDAAMALYSAVGDASASASFYAAHVLPVLSAQGGAGAGVATLRIGALRFAASHASSLDARALAETARALVPLVALRRGPFALATSAVAASTVDRVLCALSLADAAAAGEAASLLLPALSEGLAAMAGGDDAHEFLPAALHRACACVVSALLARPDAPAIPGALSRAPSIPGALSHSADPHVLACADVLHERLAGPAGAVAHALAAVLRTPAAFAPAYASAVHEAAALLAAVPEDRVQRSLVAAAEPYLSPAASAFEPGAAGVLAAAVEARTHTSAALAQRILPHLLSAPSIWTAASSADSGVSSLARLLGAVVFCAGTMARGGPGDVPAETLSDAAASQVLAVFQRLCATRTHDVSGLHLAAACVSFLGVGRLRPLLPAVIVAVLRKLQAGGARKLRTAQPIVALFASICVCGVAESLSSGDASLLGALNTTPVPLAAASVVPSLLEGIQPRLLAMVLASLAPQAARIRDAHDRRLAAVFFVLTATRVPLDAVPGETVASMYAAVAELCRGVAAHDHVIGRPPLAPCPGDVFLFASRCPTVAGEAGLSATSASSGFPSPLRSVPAPRAAAAQLAALPSPHVLLRVGLATMDAASAARVLAVVPPDVLSAVRAAAEISA